MIYDQDKVQDRAVGRRLFRYLLLFRGRVALALGILLLALGAQLAGPIVTKTIIDDHLLAGASGGIPSQDFAPILWLVLLLVGLSAAYGVLSFVQSYLLQASAQRIVQRMRMDLFSRLHRLPVSFFDKTPVGQIVARAANDTESIKELYVSFVATFVVSGLQIVGVFAALLFLEWRLALLCALILPLFAAILYVHLKFTRPFVQVIRARLAEMNAMLNEMIHVMPVLQTFRREASMRAEFEKLNEDRYRSQVKQFRIFALSGRNVVYFVSRLLTVLILWYYGGAALASAAISFGALYAFVDYLGRIWEPIVGIFDQSANAQRAFVSAERVFALMDQADESADGGKTGAERIDADDRAAAFASRPEGHVEFDRVTFAYVPGEHVLKGISFEAKRGETVALVGHTGSGKSSIMNLLLGFYEPAGGAIRIDGVDIRSVPKEALRRHMGIVLQDPFLFTGDLRFNVSLYNEAIDEERVMRALRDVGAGPLIGRLANGLREPVVERGATLSAGERQLISFARALAFDPAILILDEATASVDSETEQLIQHALDVLRHGRTTFVIAHRLSTIRQADRILVLHRGEIVERGTHEELMALRGRYHRMYQLQNQREDAGAAV